MRAQASVALVGFSLLAIAPAWVEAKDLTLHQRVTTGGVVAGTHESTQYWVGNRIVTDGPSNRVIFDLDAETTTMVDKRQQTYFTQTFAETRQQADQMKAQMQKQLEKMPPEARAAMGKMGMSSTAEAAVSVKPTGKSEKIAGYEAKEYTFEAGPMAGSIWATEALQPPGGAKATEAFSKMMGVAAPGANVAQAIAQIPGVPLRTSFRSGAGAQTFSTTTEVVEISEKAPPAGVLTVPDGFKKVDSPLSRMHVPKGVPVH
jgi:hypothetical protein